MRRRPFPFILLTALAILAGPAGAIASPPVFRASPCPQAGALCAVAAGGLIGRCSDSLRWGRP